MGGVRVRLWQSVLVLMLVLGWGGAALAVDLVSGSVTSGVDETKQFFVRWETLGPSVGKVEWGLNEDSTQMTSELTALDGVHRHILPGAQPGMTYAYRLHVYDWSGNGFETEWDTIITPPLEPPSPTVRGASEQAMVTWGPSFGAVAYEVTRQAVGEAGSEVTRVEGLRHLDTDLTDGTTYEYTVAAIDQAGNVSEPSEPVSVTIGSAVIDESFDDELNPEIWRVYGSNPAAQVRVADGALWVEGLGRAGWDNNDRGVMLDSPIDLTHAVTTVEIVYREAGWTGQVPGFWGRPDYRGSLYDEAGMMIGLAPREVLMAIGAESTTIFTPDATGVFSPGIQLTGAVPRAPYTLKWVITHEQGPDFQVDLYVDGDHLGSSDMQIGNLDPTQLWFYLFVINYEDAGPAAFDRVHISQTFM